MSERDWRRKNKAGGRDCLLVGCCGGRMSMEEDVMPMGQTGDALETLAVDRTSE